ncbi:hypothetical protein CU044_2537 [Streptomyces sp. L-9-10]|nr:hypothetical protein CU044_2537 [Streptomyces sp. L-9-10]
MAVSGEAARAEVLCGGAVSNMEDAGACRKAGLTRLDWLQLRRSVGVSTRRAVPALVVGAGPAGGGEATARQRW